MARVYFRDLDSETWEECEHNPRELLAKTSAVSARRSCDRSCLPGTRATSTRVFNRTWLRGHTGESDNHDHVRTSGCLFLRGVRRSHFASALLRWFGHSRRRSSEVSQRSWFATGRNRLLYRYGYFRQRLRNDGWQEEHYGETFPSELPIHLVRTTDGTPLRIEVSIRERNVLAQVWRADVGRVPLYLLDTNIPENVETDRWVTGHLYGGDRETRIVQEMLLGIGGVRLLRKARYRAVCVSFERRSLRVSDARARARDGSNRRATFAGRDARSETAMCFYNTYAGGSGQ